jgi:hypothetical protein
VSITTILLTIWLNLKAAQPSRVAVELDPASARDLAHAILEALKTAGPL